MHKILLDLCSQLSFPHGFVGLVAGGRYDEGNSPRREAFLFLGVVFREGPSFGFEFVGSSIEGFKASRF